MTAANDSYDVFVSYSHADKPHAVEIDSVLRNKGLKSFFDRRNLDPGLPWIRALEKTIGSAKAAIVLIGPHGFGNTQQYERELAIIRQTREPDFRVIPVILPNTGSDLPFDFLQNLTWVDFSQVERVSDAPDELERLLTAIERGLTTDDEARQVLCPWRGLDAFREEDSALFFGRGSVSEPESPIGQLVRKVREHRFVMVVGRSGSGKSSLVFAGLVPALRRDRNRFRNVLTLRPGPTPLRALAAAFNPRAEGEGAAEYAEKITKEADRLRTGDSELLSHMIREELDQREGKPDELLLYIDQWEELYAQGPSSNGQERTIQSAADVSRFIDLLLTAARTAPVAVVGTVRADFYDPLIAHPDVRALLPTRQVLLARMSRSELESTIVEPANKVGLAFDPPGLVQRILDEAGEDEGMLPLLQYALKESWALRKGNTITADSYARSGGVREAIRNTAERTFERLSAEDQQAARQLFLRLVTPGEGQEDTRARAAMPSEPTQRRIVDQFAGPRTRLLVTGSDHAARPMVEVAHEALIRRWPRLRVWIDANREKLRSRAAVLRAQADWEQNSRPDDLLLSSGFALARARELLEDPGDITIDDINDFVSLSFAREQKRIDANKEKDLELARLAAETERMRADLERQRAEVAEGRATYEKSRAQRAQRTVQFVLAGVALVSAIYFAFEAHHRTQQQLTSAQKARAISFAAIGEQTLLRDGAAQGLLVAIEGLKGASGGSSDRNAQLVPIIPQTQRLAYRALQDLREKYIIPGERFSPPLVSFSPYSDFLMVSRSGGNIRLFDTKTGTIVANEKIDGVKRLVAMKWTDEKQNGSVFLVELDENRKGSVLALHACSKKTVNIGVDCLQGEPRSLTSALRVLASNDPLRTVSPDGQYLLSGAFGATETRLWSVREQRVVDVQLPPSGNSTFNSDSSAFALGLSDRVVVYDMKTFSSQEFTAEEMTRPSWRMTALALGPKNTSAEGKLFTASVGVARLWDLRTKQSQVLPRALSATSHAIFSPTGDSVAAVLDNGGIQVWRWYAGGSVTTFVLVGHKGFVTSVDFSRDGRLIATGSTDGTARVWRVLPELAPEVYMASAQSDLALEIHSFEGRVLENNEGVLSVRDQAAGEPFVVLNKKSRNWQAYSFVPGGVSAISENRRYFWKIFSSAAELSAFAQDHLPVCDGKHLSLTAERAILLGIAGPSPTSSLDAGVEVGERAAQESNCYPLQEGGSSGDE
jgi:energy-coupling factor transporter ATP-binding protein EcfA2